MIYFYRKPSVPVNKTEIYILFACGSKQILCKKPGI